MGRNTEEFGTDRGRAAMDGYDYCAHNAPTTIGDQLDNGGWQNAHGPEGSNGRVRQPAPHIWMNGDANWYRDGDADDYNVAAQATGSSGGATSSSGPF